MSVSDAPTPAADPIVPGRSCGSCTLCCKVLSISALQKPRGVWCSHCSPGSGCSIHATKPDQCTTFYCGYLTVPDLGDEWKPIHCKIVLVLGADGTQIAAHVDQQRPDAWRREPYYSRLKLWARRVAPHRGQVVAMVGARATVILPDRDVDLGIVGDDEMIVTSERKTPFGVELDAFKMRRDDPRAERLAGKDGSSDSR